MEINIGSLPQLSLIPNLPTEEQNREKGKSNVTGDKGPNIPWHELSSASD